MNRKKENTTISSFIWNLDVSNLQIWLWIQYIHELFIIHITFRKLVMYLDML